MVGSAVATMVESSAAIEHDEHQPREDQGELAAVELLRSVSYGQPSLLLGPVSV